MKITICSVLAASMFVGCAKDSKLSDEPNVEPASSPVKPLRRINTKEKRPEIVPHEGPIALQINHKENCVTLKPGGICYVSHDELQKAAPNLSVDVGNENLVQLAQVIDVLSRRPSDQLLVSKEQGQEWWSKWFNPQDATKPESVVLAKLLPPLPVDQIQPPTLADGVLTYDTAQVHSPQLGAKLVRRTLDFKTSPWKGKGVVIAGATDAPHPMAASLAAFFGGPVDGYAQAFVGLEHIYFAIGPKSGAKPFVWAKDGESPRGYATWAELEAAHPLSKQAVTAIADMLRNFPEHRRLNVITDAAAYRANHQKEQRLKYEGNELRVTRFDVKNWDELTDPAISNGRLVAFFRDGQGQPHRMDYDLTKFASNSPAQMTPFFTSQLVSDTKHPVLQEEPPRP
ncbi:MAG: hypothetical protein R3E66_00255 [bacterium]